MTTNTTNTEPIVDTPPEKLPEQMITGYQWGADKSYIGTYAFPSNQDQEAVHLPPMTTLMAPPAGLPRGKEAAFDVAQGAWIVRDEDLSWMDAVTRAAYLAMEAKP